MLRSSHRRATQQCLELRTGAQMPGTHACSRHPRLIAQVQSETPGEVLPKVPPRGPQNLDSQALAALGAARIDDRTATARFHANQETVSARAARLRRLICAFHDKLSFN